MTEEVVLDSAHKEMQSHLEIGQIVDSSFSLRKRWGEAQERSDEGLGRAGENLYNMFVNAK